MTRYLVTLFLVFCYLIPSLTGAAEVDGQIGGSRLFGNFLPKPGFWSEYAVSNKATGRSSVMRLSIVGVEGDSYWYEVMESADKNTRILKMLIKGDPLYQDNILRLIIKLDHGPAREIIDGSAFLKRQAAGQILEQRSGIPVASSVKLKSVSIGEDTATVPAGTFAVTQHEIVNPAGKVYARYNTSQEVYPFGIISSETDSATLVLIGLGSGAKTYITEEPVIMKQSPDKEQRGIIMQIPGMGTGYESKD